MVLTNIYHYCQFDCLNDGYMFEIPTPKDEGCIGMGAGSSDASDLPQSQIKLKAINFVLRGLSRQVLNTC